MSDLKNFPGVSVTELGPLPANRSVSVVGASGGGGLPVQITEPIGSQPSASSVSVTFASDEPAHHVIVDSSALPTGAATSAAQGTGNTSLASIDTKTPALGQALAAASTPVVLTAAQVSTLTPLSTVTVTQATGTNLHTTVDNFPATQSVSGTVAVSNFPATQPVSGTVTANAGTGTFAVSAASLPLPTGAATEASLVKLPLTQGSTTSGESGVLVQGAVTTAAPAYTTAQTSPISLTTAGAVRVDGSGSTQPVSGTVAATQSGTWNITNVSGTVSLPTGAATAALQSTPINGRAKVQQAFNDYTGTAVTTATYVTLIASTSADANLISVFDSSGQTIIIAVGAAASEVDQCYVFPGGQGNITLRIPSGSRVSLKAKTATASVGYLALNLFS